MERAGTNIDFFHIFDALHCIRIGSKSRTPCLEAMNFYKSLSESVYVIWYEAPAEVDARRCSRVSTSAGSHSPTPNWSRPSCCTRASESKRERRSPPQWDSIERDLRVPELWAFVTGGPDEEADTHQPSARHPRRRADGAATVRCSTPSRRSGR